MPKRRKPGTGRNPETTIELKVCSKSQLDDLISALRNARKTCVRRGGNKHVTVHDYHEPSKRAVLLIDLTGEIIRE